MAEGDQLWQLKLSRWGGGGGEVAVLQIVWGDQAWLLQLVRGGINFGGTSCSMTGLYWT